jgi:glycosyltransferase involved in cell wall biosynthesis
VHVALDALDFFPGRMGGIETYLRNLVAALQEVPGDDLRFTLVCLSPLARELPVGGRRWSVRELPAGRPSPGWLARRLLQRLAGKDLLAPAVNRLRPDVVHHPFTTINTRGLRAPAVLTFHDMQHEFLPELFGTAELEARRRAYGPSARAAARVIAISHHVKATLVARYGLDPGKIDVVHQAHGAAFRPQGPDAVREARRRHGLARPFLYYPAASWPHKNHVRLLQALRLLLDRGLFDGELVLSGIARGAQDRIEAEIDRLGLAGRVRFLGWLRAEDLPALYAAAELLVFPSLFEGFGIPVLEAMAVGCPVACSDATSLPEIAGDAALTFDARLPEAIAARVAEVLGSRDLRRRLAAAGLARAAEFRWDRAARETIAVYRRAAAGA